MSHKYPQVTLEQANEVFETCIVDFMAEGCTAFLTHIALSLNLVWDDSQPTAYTNGINLGINPHWFHALRRRERVGLLAHEAWHVACDHMLVDRMGSRDPKQWNEAADYRINAWLTSEKLPLPPHGLIATEYFDDEWTTEKIYDDLEKKPKDKKMDMGDLRMVNGGDPSGQHGGTQQDINPTVKDQVDAMIKQAAVMEQAMKGNWGHLPGQIQKKLEELFNPKLPWYSILRRFMDHFVKEDYSYQKFNRRYPGELFMPALYSEQLGTVAAATDWSCSVSDMDAKSFTSEIQGILDRLQPEALDYVSFDTAIRDIYRFKPGDKLGKVKFTGRGGTNLQPVFDYYDQKPPLVLVIFSDLECTPITKKPKYPVVWIKIGTRGFTPTFGKVIQYEPHT